MTSSLTGSPSGSPTGSPAGFTGERIVPGHAQTLDDHLMYLRHVAAYELAADRLVGAGPVLEVGSGEGYGAALLAERGIEVTGLEVDLETVVRARQRHAGPRCRFVRYGGGTLPFSDRRFAGALSLQVLEHVAQDGDFVGEIARVLVPGAAAVLTTPNAALRLRPGQRPWNRYHVREYRAEELHRLLAMAFSAVEIRGLAGSPEVQRLEHARLRRIRAVDRLDPLRLRARLPVAWETRLRGWLRRVLGSGTRGDGGAEPWRRFGVESYSQTDDLGAALDLVAICRR